VVQKNAYHADELLQRIGYLLNQTPVVPLQKQSLANMLLNIEQANE
jgi:hypothetical protein